MNTQLDIIACITGRLRLGLVVLSVIPSLASPARAEKIGHEREEARHKKAEEAAAAEAAEARARAAHVIVGDDYPAAWKDPARDQFANISGLNRECVSFASWKVYENSGGRQVPTGRDVPSDWLKYSINVDQDWGSAWKWSGYAAANHIPMDNNPTPGSIAQWVKHPSSQMFVGHVGVVKTVYSDGSIDIEQYNLRENGRYSILHMSKGSSAVDRSNGNGPWTFPWPDHFIHIHGR